MTDLKGKNSVEEILTFDPEEALLRGQIPLKEFEETLKNIDESKVVKIDFSRNGYCNDAVLKLILSQKKSDYSSLRDVILDGCILITDAGIKWLSEIIEGSIGLQKIVLDGCTNLGDNELYLLTENVGAQCEIYMRGTSVRYVTDLEMDKIKVEGCPLFGTEALVNMNCSHVLIFPHKSLKSSLCHFMKDKKTVKRESFHRLTDFEVRGWDFTITEMNLEHPLFEAVISRNPTQIIIPFDGGGDEAHVRKHIYDSVVKVITKTVFTAEYRKAKEKFDESSNASFLYGIAKIKLLRLAHKLEVTKDTVPIYDDQGVKKGALECSIELCKANGDPLEGHEPLSDTKELLSQELHLRLRINFATGLDPEIESTFCKFKFFNVFNQFVKTSEIPGSHPYFKFDRLFFVRAVKQKLLTYLEKSSLKIEVWGRKKMTKMQDGTNEQKLEVTVKDEDNLKMENMTHYGGGQYRPCEFVVLETGNKPEMLGSVKLTPEMFDDTLEQIDAAIEDQKRKFPDLDLHAQSIYSSLCKTREILEEFSKQTDHIHYMSVDLQSSQASDSLLQKMTDIMDYHKYHQCVKYSVPQKSKRIMKTLLQDVQREKILNFDSTGMLGSEERDLKITGDEIMQLALILHEQGKIAIIPLGLKTLLVDVDFLETMVTKLADTSSMQPCGKMATSIGETSQVWTSQTLSNQLSKEDNKIYFDQLLIILQEYLGLIEIPAWRFHPDDTQFVYTVSKCLATPSIPLREYWKSKDASKDFVVMERKYRFIHPVSDTLLSGILSSATTYGRTLMLTQEGAVFEIGCVQTAIIKNTDTLDNNEISIESKCYLPEKKTGPVNDLTEHYVKQYTWNIFCVYIDIAETILKQCNTVYIVFGEIPKGFVNKSFGCTHNWSSTPSKVQQSVCTMCNKCCYRGRKCWYNGIMGYKFRECRCKTLKMGCVDCGICVDCAKRFWNVRSYLRPLVMTSSIDKENIKLAEQAAAERNELESAEIGEERKEDMMENPFLELSKYAGDFHEQEVQERKKCTYHQVPFDPVAFNEVEIQHISNGNLGVVLREIDNGSRIVIFPGKATAIDVIDGVNDEVVSEKISQLCSNVVSYRYKFNPGDTLRIRLTDPFRAITKEKVTISPVLETNVVYHTTVCRDAMISHETGLLCYHSQTGTSAPHKAYFVGSRAFSDKFRSFSIKIIEAGLTKFIGLGVSADKSFKIKSTGRDLKQADFIKYYIGRGGLYTQRGCFATKDSCDVGDIVTVSCDVVTQKIKLLKNGDEFFEGDIEVPPGGYYPQISLNSEGECIQLMEKEPWRPDPDRVKENPAAFDIYKYSNLWISPARTIEMTNSRTQKADKRFENSINGWIIVKNTTNQHIGYSIHPCSLVNKPVGCLEPGESKPFHVSSKVQARGLNPLESGVRIIWAMLEQEKTIEEVKKLLDKPSGPTFQHRLNCVVKSSHAGESDALPLFNNSFEAEGESYKLTLFKNSRYVNSYCLKKGKYVLDLYNLFKGKEPEYILKRPKCPSFLYPSSLQIGMKSVVKLKRFLAKDEYADAVVTEQVDGGYRLEYTPEDTDIAGNIDRLFCEENNVGINDDEWKKLSEVKDIDDIQIFAYKGPVKKTLLNNSYVPAPPYLVTKGSGALLYLMNPNWQTDVLRKFSSCAHVVTSPAIQEQNLTRLTRYLLKWLKYRDSKIPYASVFLPAKLDGITLMYPQVTDMYSNVSVHRLCFFHEKYMHDQAVEDRTQNTSSKQCLEVKSQYSSIKNHFIVISDGKNQESYTLKNPREVTLHFMDMAPYYVKNAVPVDLSYGCLYQGWTYVALLANELFIPANSNSTEQSFVPACSRMFTGGTGHLHCRQIESLLYQLIHSYASLCCIYSTQYGTLANQHNPRDYEEKILNLCTVPKLPINTDEVTEDKLIDSHSFWALKPFVACKAHRSSYLAHNSMPAQLELSLGEQFYQPYSRNLDTLKISNHKVKFIPHSFFEIFKNIHVMAFLDVAMDTMSLPLGISKCVDLTVMCLSAVEGLTELPKDILTAPALSTLYIHNTQIKYLNIDWPVSSVLTTLNLTGLLLEEVPKGIGKLNKLKELILDYNPITDLPDELKTLQSLRTLSLRGIPWITGRSLMPKLVYDTAWLTENPYILNYMTREMLDKLFKDFDHNNNNILEMTELAKLNMYFMTKIPRLGMKKLDDQGFGVVPSVICELQSLQKLDMSYTAITFIPDQFELLSKLQTLTLEHCPLLDSISGQVGLLPDLKVLHLNGCPLLETPPLEIVGRGSDAVKAFLKRIAGGSTECHRTKLMFIGLGQAGKTTLLEALRHVNKKVDGSIEIKLTDGIDIKPWIVPVFHEGRRIEITYSCWDFAGQTVYYNTHQFFLSKQAVYMLLWNMRMGFEHAGLDFWLSSIACHCPDAPVIVVGTQLDQIPMPDIPELDLMEKYPQIKKFCYVSSTQGINIAELEQTLIDVTMNHCSQMKLKIPKVWLSLENAILSERNHGQNIMEWTALRHCAIDNGLFDEKDTRLAVQFLNDLGTVQYFDTDFLRDRVVINPQWIVDVMAKVVSVNEKLIKENKGKFYHKFMSKIWKGYDPSLHQWMLKLTERFDLTFPLPDESDKFNIVPCLLPETRPQNLPWPYLSEDEGIRELTILYKFTYLPSGLFNRAQARLFSQGFTDRKLLDFLWKKGSILKKNQHYALVKQVSDYEMIVSVQGPRPKNVMDLIHETLSTLIKDAFVGVDYDYYIQCPDCVDKEGTKEPFLFQADLINRAYSVNAPFLQCTKFFHTISIGELLRIMPESKETEFDAQIQESISTLEEISNNMAKDVAILYCPADIPLLPPNQNAETAGKMPVDPGKIHDDLKKAGYNCWFPTDVDNIQDSEMTLSVKNSKVLVVCMSDNFVRHEKCHRMFLYAIEQLHKPFAVAVVSESLDWQQTDLGFKIGNPKMAMMKNIKRYPEKLKDLLDIIKSYIDDLERIRLGAPSVFISYCWANSHEACSSTTQAKPGSIGYGDPRVLKTHLEKNGIKCWLDIEQFGKFGLYQDITVGLQNSKVLVICVSDEYLESDACMMEARFGVYNLLLPTVVCVVGTGKVWKSSEVILMVQKQGDLAKVVKMQKENPAVYDQVLEFVRTYLSRPETEKQRKIRERVNKVKQDKMKKEDIENKMIQKGDTKFSFQEEIELIQRKFMRYVTKLSLKEDTAIPRLLVIDFSEKKQAEDSSFLKDVQSSNPDLYRSLMEAIGESSKFNHSKSQDIQQSLMSKAVYKDVDNAHANQELSQIQGLMDMIEECIESKWEEQDLTLRVMCEYEQGWHFYGISLGLDKLVTGAESVSKLIKETSPYLARFYTILKQSGVNLNCVASPTGEVFLSHIRKEGTGTNNFADAYRLLWKVIHEYTEKDKWWLDEFPRCCLPNGKVSYLCEEHMNKLGATIIPHDSNTSGQVREVLSEEDKYLREVLSENVDLKRIRGMRNSHDSLKDDNMEMEKTEEKLETVEVKGSEKTMPNATSGSTEVDRIVTSPVSTTSSASGSQRLNRQKSQRRTSQACSIQ